MLQKRIKKTDSVIFLIQKKNKHSFLTQIPRRGIVKEGNAQTIDSYVEQIEAAVRFQVKTVPGSSDHTWRSSSSTSR